jgi:uncharacterized protein YjiS (DUF1127 family)
LKEIRMSNLAQRASAPLPATGWSGGARLRSPRSPSRRRSAVGRFWQWLLVHHQRRRSINQLMRLNERMLRDIGIARPEIADAVDRLLWEQRFGTMGQARDARRVVNDDWQDR